MKKNFLILFLIIPAFTWAQKSDCDCIVKLYEPQLMVQLNVAKKISGTTIPDKYAPIQVKKGLKYAIHKVIKDSAQFWVMNPYFRDNAGKQIRFIMDKLPSTFIVEVQFNKFDSVPLFTEANEKSKIVKYIHNKKMESGNDYWLTRCSKDFVKITSFEKGMVFQGWIKKENYLSK